LEPLTPRPKGVLFSLSGVNATPTTTPPSGLVRIASSEQAVNAAIPRLVEAQILDQTTLGRRNRAFEASEMIDAFSDLERRLASPASDTPRWRPARAVPRRRPKRRPERSPVG
jgi:hypothetical protein